MSNDSVVLDAWQSSRPSKRILPEHNYIQVGFIKFTVHQPFQELPMLLRSLENLMLCDDCHLYHGTGDASFLSYQFGQDEASADARLNQITDGLSKLGQEHNNMFFQNVDESPEEFSTAPCDSCGTSLAGGRIHYTVVGSWPYIIGPNSVGAFTKLSSRQTMQTQLTIRHTSNYGNEVYYPNCAQSHNVARIAGTKTLTESCLKLLQKMGFEIIIETD